MTRCFHLNANMRDVDAIAPECYWEDRHRPEQRFFRCPVPIENSAATLHFSGTAVPVEVNESSIDGFSVSVKPQHMSKLRLGPRWVLQSATQRSEVWPQWLYCAPDGHVQVGLRRLQDLAPPQKPGWRPRWRNRGRRASDRGLLYSVLILLAALAVCWPSLNERLQQSPAAQQALRLLVSAVSGFVNELLRLW